MSSINIATLFSGIGSPEQGASRIYDNVNTVFACEYDKFARQSYEANYAINNLHFHKDINDLDARQYKGKVDILIGGSPCQTFSIAGMRRGTEDERGQLIYQYIRIVEEVKSDIIIYENVKGMLSIDNGATVKEFTQALRDIGYHCHRGVLNTKHYGIPQNRERLYIVGFLDVNTYHRFSFDAHIPLDLKLKDLLEEQVSDKYYLSQKALEGFKAHCAKYFGQGNGSKFSPTRGEGTAMCITTKAGDRPKDNFLLRSIPNRSISCPLTTYEGEGIKIAGRLDTKGSDQQKRIYETGGVSPTLTTMQGGRQEPKILQGIIPSPLVVASRGRNVENPSSRIAGDKVQQRLEVNVNGTSNTITSVQKDNYLLVPSATKNGYEVAKHQDCINLAVPNSKTRRGRVGEQVSQTLNTTCNIGVLFLYNKWWWVRKLTPRECLRLQDFPDSFKIVVSNSQAYKQAGNSMSVNILEMIFRQIEKAKEGVITVGRLF